MPVVCHRPRARGARTPVDGKHVTVIEHDAVRVVVLDSLLYVDRVAGLLGRAQRAWLEGFLPTIADRHVKAVFHGHAHVWAVGRRDRLPVVSLPAVGYSFDDVPAGGLGGRAVPRRRRVAHPTGRRRQPRGRREGDVPGVGRVSFGFYPDASPWRQDLCHTL